MRSIVRWALAPLAVMALAGCGGEQGDVADGAAAPSDQSLAAALNSNGEYDALAQAMSNAQLEAALDGAGPYTLFAPSNADLTTGAVDFTDPELGPESAAMLQAHMVPGAVTRADIAAAIDRAGDQEAQMRTMDGGLVTFTRDGETFVVTSANGAAARLTGEEELVRNGALQPVEGLLMSRVEAAG